MSKPRKYDIRSDGRVWINGEPVDSSEYPVLDHIIRALAEDTLARFTYYDLPNHGTLHAPDGSWVDWSGDCATCQVDSSKYTLEDMHYCMDRFKSFVPALTTGALDRTGAALGPLDVALDFHYGYVLLFRDRTDKVAHFDDDGPDDRPLSKHLADWGTRLQASLRKTDNLYPGRVFLPLEEPLEDPEPRLKRELLDTYIGRQDPDTALAHSRDISAILTELPALLEYLR